VVARPPHPPPAHGLRSRRSWPSEATRPQLRGRRGSWTAISEPISASSWLRLPAGAGRTPSGAAPRPRGALRQTLCRRVLMRTEAAPNWRRGHHPPVPAAIRLMPEDIGHCLPEQPMPWEAEAYGLTSRLPSAACLSAETGTQPWPPRPCWGSCLGATGGAVRGIPSCAPPWALPPEAS